MNARIMLSIGAAVFAVGGTAVTGVVTQGYAFATSAPNAKKAASEADAELIGWIRAAYDAAG